jgi:hypothetical protein
MNQEFEFEIESLLYSIQPPAIEYRLYYNEGGNITACTMIEDPAIIGSYVVVDKETYDNYFRYTVVDGKLKKFESDAQYRVKLRKSTQGLAVVKNHAGIILESGDECQDIEYYERIN